MSALDTLIFGYRKIIAAAVELIQRDTLEFVGATVTDDTVNKRTVVTLPGGSIKPGLSNVLYVDKGGNDTTAQRGNIGLPYATLTAALAAAQSGDVVKLGPGTWTDADPDLGWQWPELAKLSVIGSGRDVTILRGTISAGGATLSVLPATATEIEVYIADLTLEDTTGFSQALAAGSINGAVNTIAKLDLRNVRTRTENENGASLGHIRDLYVSGCRFDNFFARGIVTAQVIASHSDSGFEWKWEADDTTAWTGDPALSGYYSTVWMASCRSAGVTPIGAVKIDLATSRLDNLSAALTNTDAYDFGYVTAHGCVFDAVAVSGTSVNTGANLDGSTMASLGVTRTSGAGRIAVSARGGAVSGAVSAGDGCDVDIRGSAFVQSSLAKVGDGTIERSTHRGTVALSGTGPDAVTFSVPFTTANYSVAYETAKTVATSSKTASGFSALSSSGADAGASYMILHD